MSFRLGGIIAAVYTPFDDIGQVRLEVIDAQTTYLQSAGVKGVFVCGTTGEGLSLTTDERMQVAARWVNVARGSLSVVVHVGHLSQKEAMALARHAAEIDADAIAALPPFYYKPSDAAELVGYLRPIAAAGGGLPFYYYHIPAMTGVAMPMVEVLEAAASEIPNFRGMKFTHSDLADFQRCLAFDAGRFEMAWGLDEMLLGALACGGKAAIGSTYNFAYPLYAKMAEAFEKGEMETARQLGRKSGELVALMQRFGGIRTGKFLMKLAGVDCGPPRSPISSLSSGEEREVAGMIAGMEASGRLLYRNSAI